MKNRKDQPICGAPIDGPRVKDGGRTRPLYRGHCRRVVKAEGERCYQHRRPTP